MSALLALFNRDGEPLAPPLLDKMLAASTHPAPDGTHRWIGEGVALAHQHFWVTPEEVGEQQPLTDPAGTVVACDARLDNRAELIATLFREPPAARPPSDAALILRAYRRWGTACVEHLQGDFAFALWDPHAPHLLLARDPLGSRSLFYYLDPARVLVASQIGQVLAHPAVPRRLNLRRVALYLANQWQEQEATFYEGILACPPAHCLVIRRASAHKHRYWEIDPACQLRYRSDDEYAAHFRHLLEGAVRDRLRCRGTAALSLSGGLDSTTLAALAATALAGRGQRLHSVSYVFDELARCDERAFIEPVVRRYDLAARYLSADCFWPLHDLARWPASPTMPAHDPYARLPRAVARRAQREGCPLLLAGYFGDVLFGGGYFWAAELMREGRWAELLRLCHRHHRWLPWRATLVDHGLRPLLPPRLKRWGQRVQPPREVAGWLHPRLRCHLTPVEVPTPAFPHAGLEARYHSLLFGGWEQRLPDLRDAHLQQGIELALPFWDRRLVEFVMALPADQLGRPLSTKHILRQATRGLLPESVRTRPDKTVFYPLLERGLLERESATLHTLLDDPLIVQHELVQAKWVQQQRAAGRAWAEHGYPFWLALSLELWLQRFWGPDVLPQTVEENPPYRHEHAPHPSSCHLDG